MTQKPADAETIAVYDAQAAKYARLTENESGTAKLLAFIAALPTAGHVLDLGCGPGHSSATMAEHGLAVTALDASREMVALAGAHQGVTARQATFDQIDGTALYDGIWANFSLLHAPRADMARHLARLHRAAKPGARLHIGLKTGTGEKRDSIGRLYTYYTKAELTRLLAEAGFTVTATDTGCDAGLDGQMADWITVTAHG